MASKNIRIRCWTAKDEYFACLDKVAEAEAAAQEKPLVLEPAHAGKDGPKKEPGQECLVPDCVEFAKAFQEECPNSWVKARIF